MGNFCTKCGRPLADGEVCNCQTAPQVDPTQTTSMPQGDAMPQAAPMPQAASVPPVQPQAAPVPPVQPQAGPQGQPYMQQPQMGPQGQPYMQQPVTPSQADVVLKDAISAFVDVMKAPVTKGQEFVKAEKFIVAIIYIAIQALLATMFSMVLTAKIGGADATMYLKVFFGVLFGSVLCSAMVAGVVMAVNAITKNPLSFKSALCVVATRSIVLCPVMLLSVLLLIFAPAWGVGLFFLADIWGIVVLIKTTPIINPASEDLLTHLYAAGLFLFVVIAYFIISKFFSQYSFLIYLEA